MMETTAVGRAEEADLLDGISRPSLVTTRMTAPLKPAPLATTPDLVETATVAAVSRRAGAICPERHLRLIFAIQRQLSRARDRRLPL